MTPTISVSNLSKHYKVPEREGGMKAAVISLFNRKYRTVKAVDNVSFSIIYHFFVSIIISSNPKINIFQLIGIWFNE